MAAVKLKVGQAADIALGQLSPDPLQPRKTFDQDDLKVLAASLKESGVLVPLIVRKGDKGAVVIVDGERRWRAAKLAGLRKVPVLLQDWGTYDAAARSISQLAINNVREPLTPMELAALVHRLRTDEKLTTNDIAARLAKMGTPMTPKDINAAGELLQLPEAAQQMVNEKQMDTNGAKALLVARHDAEVLADAIKRLQRAVGFRREVTARDVVQELQEAYDRAGIDLQRRWGYDSKQRIAHFDYRKACQGCEHLRKVGDGAYCMNAKEFDRRNAEAKAAGLEPGGKRPDKPAADRAGGKAEEQVRAERKAESHAQRVAEYFDGWLRQALGGLLPARQDLARNLAEYYAAMMPDGTSEAGWVGDDEEGDAEPAKQPELTILAGESHVRRNKAHRFIEQGLQRFSLTEFIGHPLTDEEVLTLAQACLMQLKPAQVLELAKAIGFDVGSSYSIDADYLDLKTGPQLRALAEHYEITDLPAKVGEQRAHLLRFENAQRIGLPPDLRAILEAPPAPKDLDDITADDWPDDDQGEDMEDAA